MNQPKKGVLTAKAVCAKASSTGIRDSPSIRTSPFSGIRQRFGGAFCAGSLSGSFFTPTGVDPQSHVQTVFLFSLLVPYRGGATEATSKPFSRRHVSARRLGPSTFDVNIALKASHIQTEHEGNSFPALSLPHSHLAELACEVRSHFLRLHLTNRTGNHPSLWHAEKAGHLCRLAQKQGKAGATHAASKVRPSQSHSNLRPLRRLKNKTSKAPGSHQAQCRPGAAWQNHPEEILPKVRGL